MFLLEVANSKLVELKRKLNAANINSRVESSTEEVTVLKFKKEGQLDEATTLYNEIT
jgi:hypothetical protein